MNKNYNPNYSAPKVNIKIKLFLKDDSSEESAFSVRKVSFPQQEATWQSFSSKVEWILSQEQKEGQILTVSSIKYLDDEKEYVTVSSSEEWSEAMNVYYSMIRSSASSRIVFNVKLSVEEESKGKNQQVPESDSQQSKKEEEKEKQSSEGSDQNPFGQFLKNMMGNQGNTSQGTNCGFPFMNAQSNPFMCGQGFPFMNGSNPNEHKEMFEKYASEENIKKAKNWWSENKDNVMNTATQFLGNPQQNDNGNQLNETIQNLAGSFFGNFTPNNKEQEQPSPSSSNASSSRGTNSKEENIEELRNRFKNQLFSLNQMGFTDEKKNIELLKKWHGDENRVVNELISN